MEAKRRALDENCGTPAGRRREASKAEVERQQQAEMITETLLIQ
jgi:hypothetical protein